MGLLNRNMPYSQRKLYVMKYAYLPTYKENYMP